MHSSKPLLRLLEVLGYEVLVEAAGVELQSEKRNKPRRVPPQLPQNARLL
jgi:hypothetical protein